MVSIKTRPKKMISLVNGSTLWIEPSTQINMSKIYSYLLKRKGSSKSRMLSTYSEIHKATKVGRPQVALACMVMAFYEHDPLVRIHAKVFRSSTGAKVTHKVELIRELPTVSE